MRVGREGRFRDAPGTYDQEWMRGFLQDLENEFREFTRAIDGSLGFGDGTDPDNLTGKWLTYTSNGTPDTDDTLTHDLGLIPIGFILMVPPLQGVINKGSVAWTTSQLTLRCSAASQTAVIFVVAPSHGISIG